MALKTFDADQHYNKRVIERTTYFHKFISDYCNANNIKVSFTNFLNHEHNGIISKTFHFLLNAPAEYLVNSKSFFKYYNTLDFDFQEEIPASRFFKTIYIELTHNKKLKTFLKELMGEDSRL